MGRAYALMNCSHSCPQPRDETAGPRGIDDTAGTGATSGTGGTGSTDVTGSTEAPETPLRNATTPPL